MAQFCEIAGKVTNCTDNCDRCLKEETIPMTKTEKLFALYHQREQAIKSNPLFNSAERLKYMQQFRTVFMPKGHENDPATAEVIQDIQRASRKMWDTYAELDAPRAKIQAEIDALVACYDPIVVAISANSVGWSVFVLDEAANFSAWVDVYIDKSKDIRTDWNQIMFDLSNKDDVYQKLYQEDYDVYDLFSSKAIDALIERGYIRQKIDLHKEEPTNDGTENA